MKVSSIFFYQNQVHLSSSLSFCETEHSIGSRPYKHNSDCNLRQNHLNPCTLTRGFRDLNSTKFFEPPSNKIINAHYNCKKSNYEWYRDRSDFYPHWKSRQITPMIYTSSRDWSNHRSISKPSSKLSINSSIKHIKIGVDSIIHNSFSNPLHSVPILYPNSKSCSEMLISPCIKDVKTVSEVPLSTQKFQ